MESGSNKSLYTLIAVVVFGIFLSLSYFLFQDNLKAILADVTDKSSEKISIKLENSGQLNTEQKYFTYNVINNEIKLTAYDTTGGKDIIIPTYIDGLPVTSIGYDVFNNKGLTSVVLPETLVTIDSGTSDSSGFIGAFANNNLTEIVIPSSLKTIGAYAFLNNKIADLVIPNTLTTLGVASFRTNELNTVSLGSGITTLSWGVFYDNNLTSITIPSTITSISAGALNSNRLTSVNLPNSLKTIGDYAFSCNLLTTFTVPYSVISLGSGFVDRNPTLTELNIPLTLQQSILDNKTIITNLLVYNVVTKVHDSITFYTDDVVNYY